MLILIWVWLDNSDQLLHTYLFFNFGGLDFIFSLSVLLVQFSLYCSTIFLFFSILFYSILFILDHSYVCENFFYLIGFNPDRSLIMLKKEVWRSLFVIVFCYGVQ